MNRDKGFLRLAFVLTPVFGVLGLILNRILSVSYWGASLGYPKREDMYLTLVQSIWRFVTDSRYRWMGAGKSYFIAFTSISPEEEEI